MTLVTVTATDPVGFMNFDAFKEMIPIDEATQMGSLIGFIMCVTGNSRQSASNTIKNLSEKHPDIKKSIKKIKINNKDRKTPVASFRDLLLILNVLPGVGADQYRLKGANLLSRLMAGDESLIPEILNTSANSTPESRAFITNGVPIPEVSTVAVVDHVEEAMLKMKMTKFMNEETWKGKNKQLTFDNRTAQQKATAEIVKKKQEINLETQRAKLNVAAEKHRVNARKVKAKGDLAIAKEEAKIHAMKLKLELEESKKKADLEHEESKKKADLELKEIKKKADLELEESKKKADLELKEIKKKADLQVETAERLSLVSVKEMEAQMEVKFQYEEKAKNNDAKREKQKAIDTVEIQQLLKRKRPATPLSSSSSSAATARRRPNNNKKELKISDLCRERRQYASKDDMMAIGSLMKKTWLSANKNKKLPTTTTTYNGMRSTKNAYFECNRAMMHMVIDRVIGKGTN